MECPSCGKENRDVAQFCQYCGTPLSPADTEMTVKEITEDEPAPVELEESEALPDTEAQVEEEALPTATEPVQVPPEAETEATPVEPESAPEKELEQLVPEPAPEGAQLEQQVEPTLESTESPEQAIEQTIESTEQEAAEVEPEAPTLEMVPPSVPETTLEQEVPEPEASKEPAGEPLADVETEEIVGEPLTEAETEVTVSEPLAGTETKEELVPIEVDYPEELQPQDEYLVGVPELADADLLPWRDEPEPLLPLELGTVVNGRYQVVELLSEEGRQVMYRVRDLQRCPQCGFAGNSPDEAFCASCGAVMDRKPMAIMLERSSEQSEEPTDAKIEDHFAEGDRLYWLWRELKDTGP